MPGTCGGKRIEDLLPEQPGETRISVHWFFLPVALFWLAGGIACLRHIPRPHEDRSLIYAGWACVFISLFGLLTFTMCLVRIRAGRPPETLFTIRLRLLIFFGILAGYMTLCFVLIRLSVKYASHSSWLMFIWMVAWVVGGNFIMSRMIRYFRTHPPGQKFTTTKSPFNNDRKY
jgi:hypothetical protein